MRPTGPGGGGGALQHHAGAARQRGPPRFDPRRVPQVVVHGAAWEIIGVMRVREKS